jgi:checkpoint serine/threonine-protein kinase
LIFFLKDLINYHIDVNEQFPYWFVLYLTLEMLNILDYLHRCKIIHCDIKPDNFLIDTLPHGFDYFTPDRTKCLILIDFNQSIDQNSLPDQTEFVAKVNNKSLLCTEMKSDKSWSKQVIYYSVDFKFNGKIFINY